MAILKRLDLFWLHSDCTKTFKLQVLNAVIRAKLMYGMESAQINDADLAKIDTFQLKGLRKILGLQTTYGQMKSGKDKTNKNEFVIQQVKEALTQHEQNKPEKKRKQINF